MQRPSEQAVNIQSLIGHKVLIKVYPQAIQEMDITGLEEPAFYAELAGVDGSGIWVKHPRFCITPAYNQEGDYIPPGEREQVCYKANVLIKWQYLNTVVEFPDREGFAPSEEGVEIGFTSKVKGGEKRYEPVGPGPEGPQGPGPEGQTHDLTQPDSPEQDNQTDGEEQE